MTTKDSFTVATDTAVHTYHCLCTNLLFATSTPVSELPTRNASDHALILPLPATPAAVPAPSHYGTLLSTSVASKPQVITKSDGFEKRWTQHCGRCRIAVGYQLDWTHWSLEAGEKHGRRDDVVFLLPGGFMATDDMVAGKDMAKDIRITLEN